MSSFNTQFQQKYQMSEMELKNQIYKRAKKAPVYNMLLRKGRYEIVNNAKFDFVSTALPITTFQLENVDNSNTTVTVKTSDSNINYLRKGSIIFNVATKEFMQVTNVSGKQLTVTRGFASSTATAITGATDNLMVNTGTPFEEGSNAPDGSIVTLTDDFNYCQIFRHSFNATRRMLKTQSYIDTGTKVGSKRKQWRSFIMDKHLEELESALFFGARSSSVQNGKQLTTSGGILSFIKSNNVTISEKDKFNVVTMNDFMGRLADKSTNGDKLLIYGSGFMSKLNNNIVNVFGGGGGTVIKKYGLDIKQVATEYGMLDMMYHPIFSNALNNSALFLDLETVDLMFMDKTKIEMNIENNGYDGVIDTILTDVGFRLTNENASGLLTLSFAE